MKAFLDKHLRPCRRWTDMIPVSVIIVFLVAVFSALFTLPVAAVTQMARVLRFVTGNEDVARFMMLYFDTIGSWILTLLIIWIFRANHPMFKAIRHNARGNTFRWLLIGLAIGFCMNAFCILISVLSDNIKLTFNEIDPVNLVLFFLFVFIQSSSEEALMRCYLYQKLRRRYPHPAVAIIGNALIFSLLHALNPGFNIAGALQIIFVGLLCSLLVYYFGSFWAVCALHTAWNFTQSILFGLPNSGIVSAYSVFKLDAASATNGFFYNVGFGVEGSHGSTVVLAACCAVVFLLGRKGNYREDLWKDTEAAERKLPVAEQEAPNE